MTLRNIIILSIFIGSAISTLPSYSQQYINPLTIPPALSGNFGELRNNHFHSGIDFKTKQVVGHPVVAIEDGFVSRISVSPGGYGLALYIDHPSTGHTSVYGHLSSFSVKIADYVTEKQYEQESFQINLLPDEDVLPVKKGEQVALSGNSGSSGGPHLHFEIRDTRSEEPMDALAYLARIADTQKPDLRGIALYPMMDKGVVNGSSQPLRLQIGKDKAGNLLSPGRSISAWGRIGAGVKAYDRMNGQSNIYGVKHIRLYVDSKQVFSSSIHRFSFTDTRMLNALIDFEDWRERRSFFMKSFIEPGNRLPFYETVNHGYVDIHEEREYQFRYELEDHYGNVSSYQFNVQGKKQPIPMQPPCKNWFAWNLHNSFIGMGFSLSVPEGNLYHSICFNYRTTKSNSFFSDLHQVNNKPVPLHSSGEMWIRLHTDTLLNRHNYGIVKINENGSESWVGGTYLRGGITGNIRELGGRYAVSADSIPPVITPVAPEKWASQRRIRVRLSDNKSGIASFRGEINGVFVLFTHDTKSNQYTYRFDNERLSRGTEQELIFKTTDGAKNSSTYSYSFSY